MPQGFAQSTLGRCQNITPYYRITDSRRHVSTIWVEFTLGENASFVETFSRWLRRNLQWEMMEKCHFSIFWTLLSKHRFFNEPLQRKRRKSREHAFMFNFLFTICRTVPSFQRNDFNNLCQGNMFQDVLHLDPGHYQSCGLHIFLSWILMNTPLKTNMEYNHGGLVQIIVLSKWVICRFHVSLPGCM